MGLPVDRMTHLAAQIGATAAMSIAVLFLAFVRTEALAQGPGGDPAQIKAGPAGKDRPGGQQPALKLGLSVNAPGDVSRLHAAESHGQEDRVSDRHGRARGENVGDAAQLDDSRVSA